MQSKGLIIWRNVFILSDINHERHDLTASDSSHRRSGSVMDVISYFVLCQAIMKHVIITSRKVKRVKYNDAM
jgi:hypothetical protein